MEKEKYAHELKLKDLTPFRNIVDYEERNRGGRCLKGEEKEQYVNSTILLNYYNIVIAVSTSLGIVEGLTALIDNF